IVKSGTATFYLADDPSCSPQTVQAGRGFIDNGHDTHVVRNEGTEDLVTVVVSLVPAGVARRIDEPAPPNCPSLPNGESLRWIGRHKAPSSAPCAVEQTKLDRDEGTAWRIPGQIAGPCGAIPVIKRPRQRSVEVTR